MEKIAVNALEKVKLDFDPQVVDVIKKYANNGREAVNLVQIIAGIAMSEQRNRITAKDIEWVVNNSQLTPRSDRKVSNKAHIGMVNGLAVYGPNMGAVIEIEAMAKKAVKGRGKIKITGIVEEEQIGNHQKTIKRKSMALSSLESVLTVLHYRTDVSPYDYDIHVNFPGGTPIDGPSAGITMATAIYSAIKQIPVNSTIAMTGELSIHGTVKPIGGVVAEIEAAIQAGASKVIIPKENWQETFNDFEGIEIIKVEHIEEVLQNSLVQKEDYVSGYSAEVFSAAPVTSFQLESLD